MLYCGSLKLNCLCFLADIICLKTEWVLCVLNYYVLRQILYRHNFSVPAFLYKGWKSGLPGRDHSGFLEDFMSNKKITARRFEEGCAKILQFFSEMIYEFKPFIFMRYYFLKKGYMTTWKWDFFFFSLLVGSLGSSFSWRHIFKKKKKMLTGKTV